MCRYTKKKKNKTHFSSFLFCLKKIAKNFNLFKYAFELKYITQKDISVFAHCAYIAANEELAAAAHMNKRGRDNIIINGFRHLRNLIVNVLEISG